MRMSRTLELTDCSRGGSCVLLSAPAFAQAHIRGTLTAAKDGTISVQTAKGGTELIKLANDAGLFLVTKADMSAIQSASSSVSRLSSRAASASHARFMCSLIRCALARGALSLGDLESERT